jgi:basic membrane protein A and related proteins
MHWICHFGAFRLLRGERIVPISRFETGMSCASSTLGQSTEEMMIGRRTIACGVVAALVLCTLTGIGAAGAAEPLTVGILIPGSRADKGWMESGYDGLVASQKKHGSAIKVQMIENISYGDIEQALTNLAGKNGLVIGVGGSTQSPILKVAKRFPSVRFAIVGGNEAEPVPNVAAYDVKQAEIAYVAGAAAAMLSKTGVISYVGGMEIPSIVNAGQEFSAGAQAINPKIKFISSYTGDFEDVAKAKEATLAAIGLGADVHYHILNLGLRGMEQAAREKSTKIIGSYTDRCGTDPLYIAYSITGVGFQVEYAVDQAVAGTWKPGYKPFGLALGPQAAGFVFCSDVSADMKAKIKDIEQDLLAGKIKVRGG